MSTDENPEEETAFAKTLAEARPVKPLLTHFLVVANLTAFVVVGLAGGGFVLPDTTVYLEWGANYAPAISNGEYWRLLSAAFLHFGLDHLLFNLWALWELGRLVERVQGRIAFLAIYFGAAVCGNFASSYWNGDLVISAGASGAIFGLAGAQAAFLLLDGDAVPEAVLKRLAKSLLGFVGYSLFLGYVRPGIDNSAHIAGLGAGFVLGLLLVRPLEPMRGMMLDRLAMAVGGITLVCWMGWASFPEFQHDWRAELPARRAIDHFMREGNRLGERGRATWKVQFELPRRELERRVELELLAGWRAMVDRLAPVVAPPNTRQERRLNLALEFARLKVRENEVYLMAVRERSAERFKEGDALVREGNKALYRFEATFERDG